MFNVKTLAVASLAALATISLIGCDKNTEPTKQNTINIEQDAKGGNGDIINDKDSTLKGKETEKVSQNSWSESEKEFIKKYEELNPEIGWEKGKWGFKEPPMEERDYFEKKLLPNVYGTIIQLPDGSEHFMTINEKTGARNIYKGIKFSNREALAESQRTDLSNAEAVASLNTWLGIGKIVSDKMAEGIK